MHAVRLRAVDELDTVNEAIRRTVADAIASRSVLHTGREAARIAADHPGAGLTPEEVMEMLIRVAARVGVPMEVSGPGNVRRAEDRLRGS